MTSNRRIIRIKKVYIAIDRYERGQYKESFQNLMWMDAFTYSYSTKRLLRILVEWVLIWIRIIIIIITHRLLDKLMLGHKGQCHTILRWNMFKYPRGNSTQPSQPDLGRFTLEVNSSTSRRGRLGQQKKSKKFKIQNPKKRVKV